jgi:hypothetical protein
MSVYDLYSKADLKYGRLFYWDVGEGWMESGPDRELNAGGETI